MGTRAARLALAAVTAVALASASFGAAATLGGVTARNLSAGSAAVASCDSDGVGITYTTSGSTVTGLTVTGIAAGCSGGQLTVVLSNSAGASIGAGGPATVSGTTVAVTLSPQPSAANVAAAHVSIAGP